MKTNKVVLILMLAGIALLLNCKKVEKVMLISTGSASNILINSAEVSGTILDLGDGASQHGHCYGKSTGVTIAMSKTELGVPSSNGNFSSNLTGLEAGTKYYVKAYISRGTDVAYGEEINFTTLPATLPALSTTEISEITQNSASSGGTITSEGGAPVTARGVCWSTSAVPTIANNQTSNGSGPGTFISNIGSLSSGTKYYVRAYATNTAGTSYGNEVSFTTLQLSSATTLSASSITNTTATLNGTVNANNFSTTVTFEYGLTTSYNQFVTATQSPVTGNSTTNVSANITGLTLGTTYHFRVKAVNGAGTTYGNDFTFATLQVATAVTAAATAVAGSSATLNGTVNANNLSTTVSFEYGTTTGYGQTANAAQNPVTGSSNTPVSANISGLASGTTYHFRVKAENSGGTSYGDDLTFITLQSPSATTSPATSLATTSAYLNGTVNANGISTSVSFEYGTTTVYGNEIAGSPSPVTGTSPAVVGASAGSLLPGTTYHFRVKAVSAGGTSYGNDLTFITLMPPSAATNAATSITGSNATLNGLVNANGLSTTVTFDYGLSTGYGNTVTALQSPVSGTSGSAVSYGLSGLLPNTTYYFRVKAVSSAGTTLGTDMSFTTLQLPSAAAASASSIGFTTATLNGTVNANGSSTGVTFEYGFNTGYGLTATAVQSPVTGSAATPVSCSLTGLTAGSTYHYRIKAVSAAGTTYSGDMMFTLVPTTVTDVDGNVYNVVIIGNQAWLKENLRATKYNNSASLTNVTVNATWAGLSAGAYCDYNNAPANSNPYGRLYNFYAMVNNTLLCPAGWHVPSQGDVQTLASNLGDAGVAGGKMKATTNWASPNTGATNSSGFTALPTNYRDEFGAWVDGSSQHSNMWLSSESGSTRAYIMSLHYDSQALDDGYQDINKKMGLPVRCVKD